MFFSTRGIVPALRRSAWQDMLSRHCAPFATESTTSDFEASIEVRSIGRFPCARIAQTPGRACRTRAEIGASPPSAIVVLIQVGGTGTVGQCGHSVALVPGGMTVLDLEQPATLTFDCRSIQLALHLPKARLSVPADALAALLASGLPDTVGALMGPLIRAAFDQADCHASCAVSVADAVLALLDDALHRASAPLPREPQRLPQILQTIQDYAGKHLYEDLTPAGIAQANNMSERTLHRIFGAQGMSVSQWIKQCRLERCAADLRDTGMSHRTVTDIAFQWGFNSAAHFSRVFRLQFGVTPSDYRSRVLRPGKAGAALSPPAPAPASSPGSAAAARRPVARRMQPALLSAA